MITLSEMLKIGTLKINPSNHIDHTLLVREVNCNRIMQYIHPKISPSKKYCDWGTSGRASADVGDWFETERLYVVEIMSYYNV